MGSASKSCPTLVISFLINFVTWKSISHISIDAAELKFTMIAEVVSRKFIVCVNAGFYFRVFQFKKRK